MADPSWAHIVACSSVKGKEIMDEQMDRQRMKTTSEWLQLLPSSLQLRLANKLISEPKAQVS